MQIGAHGWPRGFVSISALRILAGLHRRGGSMCIRALLLWSRLETDALCDILNELQERRWITVRWRTPRDNLPERLRKVDRVTVTREGRLFAPRFWSSTSRARSHRVNADLWPVPGPSTD